MFSSATIRPGLQQGSKGDLYIQDARYVFWRKGEQYHAIDLSNGAVIDNTIRKVSLKDGSIGRGILSTVDDSTYSFTPFKSLVPIEIKKSAIKQIE